MTFMSAIQGASYMGLTFASWEILITLRDEVEIMWTQPRRFTVVKILYFFVRYFSLAVQINTVFVARFLQARYPVSRHLCRMWLAYQAVNVYLLLGAVDIILMIRVYAFYNRRRWIGCLMLALLFFKIGLSLASAVMTVPGQEFTPACLLNQNVLSVVVYFFVAGEVVFQCVILGLTFSRHCAAVRGGWARRTPLVSLLSRDGATAFAIIIAVLIGTTIYGHFEYMNDSAHFVFPTFVSILSSVGCRLIISMQKLVIPESLDSSGHDSHDSHEFTTVIDSVWTPTSSFAQVSSSRTQLPEILPPISTS